MPATPTDPHHIKKTRVAQSFSRVADSYDDSALLQQAVGQRVFDQLAGFKRPVRTILDVGSGTGQLSHLAVNQYPDAQVYGCDIAEGMVRYARQVSTQNNPVKHPPYFICADAENLPFAKQSFDLIVSNLMLQWCSDVTAVFASFYQLLTPGGALFFSTLGPGTLHELYASWQAAYPDGLVPGFIDMHDVGDVLQANKFLGSVMSQETMVLKYKSVAGLLRDLKRIGANRSTAPDADNVPFQQGLLGKQRFQAMSEAYEAYRDEDGFLPASYSVVYGHAVK